MMAEACAYLLDEPVYGLMHIELAVVDVLHRGPIPLGTAISRSQLAHRASGASLALANALRTYVLCWDEELFT